VAVHDLRDIRNNLPLPTDQHVTFRLTQLII